jgi:hypothetical protein
MIICNDFHKLGSNRLCLNAALKTCASWVNILILVVSIQQVAQAQTIYTDTYWKLGRHAGLDFSTGVPVAITSDNCINPLNNTSTQICDRNGNVLFYSNGLLVHNKIDGILPNGDTINNGAISNTYYSYYPPWKAAVIIPFPDDSNKFYMFYENLEWSVAGLYLPEKLYYLVIDKTLDGGKGDVTLKDQVIIQNDTLTDGEVMAVKHGNGKDWWVITRKYKSNRYYKILVDSAGVHAPIAQDIGIAYTEHKAYVGICNQTLDGEKMVFGYASFEFSPLHPTQIDIVDFDRCTGSLFNYKKIKYNNPIGGDSIFWAIYCFSPNKRFLYCTEGAKMWQLDLLSSNIANSKVKIADYVGNNAFFAMKIGPDKKIYIGPNGSSRYVHVINNPDSLGVACNLQLNVIDFGGNGHWADGGMPNVPNFALGAIAPCGNVGIEAISNEPIPIQNLYAINEALQLPATTSSFVLYNLYGQQIYDSKQQQHFTFVHSGLYIYQWHTTTGKWQSGKIVVQ